MTRGPERERVVITGIGPVTPIGIGVDAFWDSLREGRSGVRRVPALAEAGLKVQIAADIPEFDPTDFMDAKAARRMARFAQLAVAAGRLAVADADLDLAQRDPERIATIVNTGGGGVTTIADQAAVLNERGPGRVSALFVPMMAGNMASCQVSIELGLRGPVITSLAALRQQRLRLHRRPPDAARRRGRTGPRRRRGVQCLPAGHRRPGQHARPLAPQRRADPRLAPLRPRPRRLRFRRRRGRLHPRKRLSRRGGAARASTPKCSAAGAPPTPSTSPRPNPQGEGAARAMQAALRNSELEPEAIDYICAHGTGTALNDAIETRAIHDVFGAHAARLAVSSPKSMTGHLMGAAGALSAAAAALALYHGVLPPTINHEHADPDCDLDYVPQRSRPAELRHALVNGFGFGGQNGVVALARLSE